MADNATRDMLTQKKKNLSHPLFLPNFLFLDVCKWDWNFTSPDTGSSKHLQLHLTISTNTYLLLLLLL